MNHVLREFLGKFVVVYFDDIFIYSSCLDDHLSHVSAILEVLQKEKLHVNLKKCTFCTDRVVFLIFVVSANEIEVDEEKVKANREWSTLKNASEDWKHYLLPKELVIHTDHESLKHLKDKVFLLLNLCMVTVLDLLLLPLSDLISLDAEGKAKKVKAMHLKVRDLLEKKNGLIAQKVNKGQRQLFFEPGDWIWVHLRNEKFLTQRKSKLDPRGDDPFHVLERINNNAYNIDLSDVILMDMKTSVKTKPATVKDIDLNKKPFWKKDLDPVAREKKKKLERPLCRSEIIVSTLLKKDGSYEKIAEYLPEDQARAATEGIQSKVLAHPDDVIEKVCGLENGKSKCIFGEAICESSSSASQQHVADLERQLQEAKDQVTTLHRFLQQKYGNESFAQLLRAPHDDAEAIIKDTSSDTLLDLKSSILQKLAAGGTKWVKKLFYKIPIAVVSTGVQYETFMLRTDEDMQVLFHCRRSFPEVRIHELFAKLEHGIDSSGASSPNPQSQSTTMGCLHLDARCCS
nr:uncharacterized protein LOC112770817 [Arachis hypogaea]